MVLLEHPVPELFRKALGRQRTFFFPGVPVLFELLLASSLSDRWLARLSLSISAGAPLPPGTAHRFLERTGVPLRNFYGATECGAIACDRSEAGTALPGCVGTPLKGVRLTVEARVKRRAPAGSGASRRILVEGKSVALGYVDARKRPRLFHGRFATCDRGRRAADGQVFLEGRLDRMINVGGRKVCPEEVEGVLLQAPGVREAVVLGISASLRGEVVAAAVAGGEALREGEVLAFCRGRLAAPRVPRRVLILPELPRTSRGKVDTARLRTLLGDSSGVLES
jgi:long-chain acyl-CoA synthetase